MLLLPIVTYGNEQVNGKNAAFIENLKQEKDWSETLVVGLGAKIIEEQNKLVAYREGVFALLCENDRNNKNRAQNREQFNSFVSQLCDMFSRGEDIKPSVEKSLFYRTDTEAPVHLIFTGLVVQQLFVKGLIDQYSQGVEKLRLINRDLCQNSKS